MKYALTYGLISGVIVIAVMLAGIELGGQHSMAFGYLVMLVGLTLVFAGVKRYRDVEKGGVIGFRPAFMMGLGIAVVASIAYVAAFELYLAATDYTFMDGYVAAIRQQREAEGVAAAAIAIEMAEMEAMRGYFDNPLLRLPMVFLEIFPVGLLVALVSAALLRNPRLLPATR